MCLCFYSVNISCKNYLFVVLLQRVMLSKDKVIIFTFDNSVVEFKIAISCLADIFHSSTEIQISTRQHATIISERFKRQHCR